MSLALLRHGFRWRYLVERRRQLDLVALIIPFLLLFQLVSGSFTNTFSKPDDIWLYVVIGVCEIADCCYRGYRAWTNAMDCSPVVRLWTVFRSLTLLLRLGTLVPVIVLIWCFAQTLSSGGFPASWRDFGLAPGDMGWAPFLFVILPVYVSRFYAFGVYSASEKEQQHHPGRTGSRTVWYGTAFVGASIGLNLLLSRLGFATFWRETNQACIGILFLPVCWGMIKKALSPREDSSDNA